MSRRGKLIRRTLILCAVPALLAAALVITKRQAKDAPYVAGQEREGITRSLDRSAGRAGTGIRFTEVTERAGIRFEHFPFERTSQLPEDMGSGAAWGDYDGDGWTDLFLVNFAAPLGVPPAEMAAAAATDRLFRNRGDGTFEDVTGAAGVGAAHRGMGAAWGDFDADGDLDLVVTSWGENILWENRGDGTFEEVTARAGLGGDGFWTGASWSDFDLDGDLDLYVCGYVQYIPEAPGSPATRAGAGGFPFTLNPSSYSPHPNRLHVNRGDGTFEERAVAAGVLDDTGRSLAAAWADFDGDGLPDLYVANDVSDNHLYRNRGDGGFDDVSYEALVADYRGAMGLAVGDWDGDLDLDLFVTHWIAQENALYSNLVIDRAAEEAWGRLVFADEADRVGLGQIALDLIGWGTAFVDFDNDGWLDLFVANGSTFQELDDPTRLVPMHPHLYSNRGAGEGFFEVGEAAGIRTDPPGVGRGAAVADYDRDGDLDVVIVRHGGRVRLLRNDSRGGHWAAFRLRATSGHPSGLGARVLVHAGDRTFLCEAGAGASYLSQHDTDVAVGLGAAARIDSLEITWLGGSREVWPDLEADRLWLVEEGREPRPVAGARAAAAAAGAATAGAAAATAGAAAAAAGGVTRAGGRRTSGLSDHAVVADLSSGLSREEKRRFWELKKTAGRLFSAGRWAEAAGRFEQMIALDGQHQDALYYRGNCLLELERYAGAKACWERLLQINPLSSRAWVQIGILHTMPATGDLYDLEAAIACFESAHRLNPEESRPLLLWGEASVARGDLEAADKILAAAHGMNPRATSALYLSAYIAWKRGDDARARALLARARGSMEAEAPAQGVLGEGDTRSPAMQSGRRQAAGRRLFAGCLDALRRAGEPVDPAVALLCVDRARATLPRTP